MRLWTLASALVPVLGAASILTSSAAAWACGGTFCDPGTPTPNGPQAMPVNQTAETVLFVMDGPEVEAHIRIEVDPDAEAGRFAWLIPVSALPEFSVGSEALFDSVLRQTAPEIGFEAKEVPDCPCEMDDDEWDDDGGSFLANFDTPPAISIPEEPDPVAQVDVGAFQATVLDASSVEGLMTWLDDRGFEQDPDAAPILADYVDQGHLFIALELKTDSTPGEVHPITIRYPGDEPCVPIRLTAIAAEPDMAIRTLFLGQARAAPSNFRSVTIDPLVLDWRLLGSDYVDVVTMAVDEAGGRAWLTEYAVDQPLDSSGLLNPAWNGDDYLGLTPTEVSAELVADELIELDYPGNPPEDARGLTHAVLGGLLHKYLPPPDGVNEVYYWSCIGCYADQADFSAWDPFAFAADFEERLVEPAAHAEDLLETWPYVTRMFTTMSPHEMTEDPTFHVNVDLMETRFGGIAEHRQFCFKGNELRVPGWPDPIELLGDGYDPSGLPFAWTVERLPMAGPPQGEVDNTQLIGQWVDGWNASVADPGLCPEPDGNDPGSDGTGGGQGGSEDPAGSSANGGGLLREGTGCGCNTGSPAAPTGMLGLVGLLGLAQRRRQRR